jgi:hypothetical protein
VPRAREGGSTGLARNGAFRWAARLAGPALIVSAVLVVMSPMAFGARIPAQHPDLLPFWLPTHCFLGRSLASGEIPAWNPHVMGGVPFAADPQSGWMYLPAMAFHAFLSCGTAFRWFITAQPILAGLGILAFLRSEGVSRASATVGGLVLALAVGGSALVLALPFAGELAWTPLMLAAASRTLSARTWEGRLAWIGATAVAWGQLAAAHPSEGLVGGTAALALYLGFRLSREIRDSVRPVRGALGLVSLLVLALPLVNLAYLLPRLAYLSRTSIRLGYARLDELATQLTGLIHHTEAVSSSPTWPMSWLLAPGLYVGAAIALICFGGWWIRLHRPVVAAFTVLALGGYVASLGPVARTIQRLAGSSILGQLYGHQPIRFRYPMLVSMAVLVAMGLEAWRTERRTNRRLLILAPGVAVWVVLPAALGIDRSAPAPVVAGLAATVLALGLTAWRPAAAALVPIALALELGAGGIAGRGGDRADPVGFGPLERPAVDAATYLTPDDIARTIQAGPGSRYVSLDPAGWQPIGYHVRRSPPDWPLLGLQQSMLFGALEEAQGYNPVQPLRYWEFVRAADAPKRMLYNVSSFIRPKPVALDLLRVGWAIAPLDRPPAPGLVPVTAEGTWGLYPLPVPDVVTVVGSWSVAASADEALRAVLRDGFRPRSEAVLETEGAVGPAAATFAGTATYEARGPKAARITVDAEGPAVVVIRNSFDPNWTARVDGTPVPVLRADYVVQGVPVPPGRHTIDLTYDDPWLGYGLLGSALAVVVLAGSALGVSLIGRRPGSPPVRAGPDAGSPAPGP